MGKQHSSTERLSNRAGANSLLAQRPPHVQPPSEPNQVAAFANVHTQQDYLADSLRKPRMEKDPVDIDGVQAMNDESGSLTNQMVADMDGSRWQKRGINVPQAL